MLCYKLFLLPSEAVRPLMSFFFSGCLTALSGHIWAEPGGCLPAAPAAVCFLSASLFVPSPGRFSAPVRLQMCSCFSRGSVSRPGWSVWLNVFVFHDGSGSEEKVKDAKRFQELSLNRFVPSSLRVY